MRRPTLVLVCGLLGAGKTTAARRLEEARAMVRLCPDEWIMAVLKDENDRSELDRLRDPVEELQWRLARRLLALGVSVILESGFWSRAGRERFLAEGRALGARVELCFLDVPLDELWRRINTRNAGPRENCFHVTREEIEQWWGWFEPPDREELAQYDPPATG